VNLLYKPARKITNTGTRKNTGFFPSKKNGRPIAFESLLERDYIYLLEFDKDVISYSEQPITIAYNIANRSYKYTPDFFVQRKNKYQLIEVKPYSKLQKILNDDVLIKKYNAAAQYCKFNQQGEFKIVTDNEICSGNILNNIKYLFSYSRLEIPASEKMEIRNQLMLNLSVSIQELLSYICEDKNQIGKYYSYILAMLYHQEISTDLSMAINKTSIIRL